MFKKIYRLIAKYFYKEKNSDHVSTPINIIGTQHNRRGENIKLCRVNETVYLSLEENNIHDKNAIHVKRNNDKSLGYIPKNIAEKLAPELRDNKCSCKAKICKINTDLYGEIFGLSIVIKHDESISINHQEIPIVCHFERSDDNYYLYLNSNDKKKDEIIKYLKEIDVKVLNISFPSLPSKSGAQYYWLIKIEFSEDKYNSTDRIYELIKNKFEIYDRDEELDSIIKENDSALESKENQIKEETLLLKDEKCVIEREFKKEREKLKKKIISQFENTIKGVFNNIEFLGNSIKFSCKCDEKEKITIFKTVIKIQQNQILEGRKRIRVTNNYQECRYKMTKDSNGSGGPSGRIYFNNTFPKKILISRKQDQEKDIEFLKNF
jgi:hypothetical protein